MKTVFLKPCSSKSTYQYQPFASKVEKIAASPRESIQLSIRGIGYESRLFLALSLR